MIRFLLIALLAHASVLSAQGVIFIRRDVGGGGDLWHVAAGQLETGLWEDMDSIGCVVGGGNQCWPEVDEVTPDDATTFIISPANPSDADAYEFDFEAITDPTSGVGTFRARCRKDTAAGRQIDYVARLRNGDDDSTISTITATDIDENWTTLSNTFTYASVNGWGTQGDLYVEIDPLAIGGGDGRFTHCTWFEVETS